ncbi:toll/interleukin-1 receptor domain-containing protein [Sphingomonas sp. HF-S3]|uniref:Toll/interleukin-1 receptor domain-containing protein n=1 Tax=Sphingomonas rustica TaxID=3103142 RepID=A0ABV0B8A2_9SPHN
MSGPPSVFISYSWDSDEHKVWVRELGERLVLNGVQVKLDQWDLVPGDSLTHFMESQIDACDFVLVVCTPSYARKSISRSGGVGYEQQIISGSLASGVERRKFIPLVRDGEMRAGPEFAIPPHFQGILAIDIRGPNGLDSQLESLLRAIFKVPAAAAPALGRPPAFVQEAQTGSVSDKPDKPARLSMIEFDGWQLISGVAMNEQYPNTFSIPTAEQRAKVVPSDFVKLSFEVGAYDPEEEDAVTTLGERMWVEVKGAYGPYLWGTLSNLPTFDGAEIGLEFGSEIVFLPEHIIDIASAEQQARDEADMLVRKKAAKDPE